MGTEISIGSEFDYGHWGTVIFWTLIWSGTVFALTYPRSLREWCIFTLFAAFLAEEFTELYGFPYTIYLFSDSLAPYPTADLLSHRAGDLWRILLKQDDRYEMVDLYHLGGGILIFGGLGVLMYAWKVLRDAQASGVPATTGPYAWVRHPQYLALVLIMLGFVVQGPTLPTLMLLPILVYLYVLLAIREEKQVLEKFGPAYAVYMKRTPRFVPKNRRAADQAAG
jgi:Putative protein-S-isoprenylcysteine methyltransferase